MNLKVYKNDGQYLYCTVCCKPLEDFYYALTDEESFSKFFIELDGSDNVFCSIDCADEIVSQKEADIEKS